MNKFEFVCHYEFPEDEYTKELVYLCLEGKYRVAYVRKKAKNGGLFWSSASVGVLRNGVKEYFPTCMQDSSFLERDIKDFLERRSWDKKSVSVDAGYKPKSMDEVSQYENIPF